MSQTEETDTNKVFDFHYVRQMIQTEKDLLNTEIYELKRKHKNTFKTPPFGLHKKAGFEVYFDGDNFFVGKKKKVNFKSYCIDGIVNELPEDMVCSFNYYIMMAYDHTQSPNGGYLFEKSFNPANTFHSSNYGSLCMGSLQKLNSIEFEDVDGLAEAIDRIADMLENIDPSSMYYPTDTKLRDIHDFLSEKDESEECRECGRPLDEDGLCDECDYCFECGCVLSADERSEKYCDECEEKMAGEDEDE